MKNLSSFGLIAIIFISSLIVINSCRKDFKQSGTSSDQTIGTTHINLGMLQSAYNKGTAATRLKLNDVSQQTIENIINSLNVDWTSYSIFTYPDSTQVVEFSMPDDTLLLSPSMPSLNDTLKYHSKTTAVFILRKDTVNMGFFMKTIEDCTAPNYQSVLNLLHYQQIPATFNGNILYFSLGRAYINGYSWASGNLTKTIALGTITVQPPIQTNNTHTLKPSEVIVVDCSETTYDVYWNTIGGGVVTHSEYLYSIVVTTCTPVGNSGSSAAPGGVSGSAPVSPLAPCLPASNPTTVQSMNGHLVVDVAAPPPSGDGSGSGSTPTPCPVTTTKKDITPAVSDIKDNVTNPCLKALIDKLTNNNTIQSDVTNMLRNTFGVSDEVNLTFDQATLTGKYANADAQTTGNQLNNLTTTFNTTQIASASQEYLLETTLHEIFHAYLDVNTGVRGTLTQHAYMIQNYINTEVQTLQQVFPSLSTHDAQCLALGGYGDLDPTTLNNAIASYNLSLNDVVSTNNSYKSGSTGTKC